MYVQPLDGSINPNSLSSPAANAEAEGALFQGSVSPAAGDNISRFVPPWTNDGAAASPYGDSYGSSSYLQGMFGPLMGVLQQLMQMLQSLMGYGGGCNPPYGSGCPPSGNGGCPPYGNERFFQNATGASDGDPHLSFNGARWNNMTSHPDLLYSDSFAGGFRISTQVTPPNGNGITWNQSATVSLNNGATTVGMNNNGQASIDNYGQSISIARGQTVQLGNGDSVTYEQNGALQVTAQNGAGGWVETTLAPQGNGVNVDVKAHDVDLGGALVRGYEQQQGSTPVQNPIVGPIPTPIQGPISGEPILNPYPPYPIQGPISGEPPIVGPYPMPQPIGEQPVY